MRVVAAHASRLLRSSLVAALRTGPPAIVTSAESLSDLLRRCHDDSPHVVVSSTSFADGELIAVISDVLRCGARVLVACDSGEDATSLLLAGASGCLPLDDCGIDEIVSAAGDVAAGNATLHPAAAAAVLHQWRLARAKFVTTDDQPASGPAAALRRAELTPREREVLDALGRGLATKQIGKDLAVSPKTVEAHVSRLMAKLGARSRAHAVALAQAHGLLADQEARSAGFAAKVLR